MTDIEIFTDGACRGNPGPGGWGAIVRQNGEENYYSGADTNTTNNRMEMMAAIFALEQLNTPSQITLTTDSNYVKQGMTEWLPNWKRRGWKTANKKPVLNLDLWQRLEAAAQPHQIEWAWVKGHSGHRENELADQLANQAIDKLLQQELKHASGCTGY